MHDTYMYSTSVQCCLYLQCVLVCIFAVHTVVCWQVSHSLNHTIYLYLVSININCTNNVCHTLCVVSCMCILFCFNVCCFLYLFLCFTMFCFVILLFLFFKSDINETKIYLLIVSNVKMKILWFEWLIISLLKLLNRN